MGVRHHIGIVLRPELQLGSPQIGDDLLLVQHGVSACPRHAEPRQTSAAVDMFADARQLITYSYTGACCTFSTCTWMASLFDPGVADSPSVRNLTFSSRSWKIATHAQSACERPTAHGVCSWATAAMHLSHCLQGPLPCSGLSRCHICRSHGAPRPRPRTRPCLPRRCLRKPQNILSVNGDQPTHEQQLLPQELKRECHLSSGRS
jgi:hypothetical protein